MGWVHGSRQTRTYVHLSLRDQDNAILKAYGIKVPENETIQEDKPKECPRCHTLNPSDAQYCRNCWMPFDIKMAIEIEEKEKEITENLKRTSLMDPILKNVIDSLSADDRVKILKALLEKIISEPDLKKKLIDELKK